MGNPYEYLSPDDTSIDEIPPIENEKDLKKYEKKVRHLKDPKILNSYKREINDYLDRIESDRERYDIPTTPSQPVQGEGWRKEKSNRPTKRQLKEEKNRQRAAQAEERRRKRNIREEREERERDEYEELARQRRINEEKDKSLSYLVGTIFGGRDLPVLPEDIKGFIKNHDNKVYRKLSLKYHPDKGGDAEIFKILGNVNDHFEGL